MFNNIKTSSANKERVTWLTRKLNLGTENVVARLAVSRSLDVDGKLSLDEIQNSGGKEYSRRVLLGEYEEVYLGMIATKYDLHRSDERISKYLKLHLDAGIELIFEELQENPNIDSFDYLVSLT